MLYGDSLLYEAREAMRSGFTADRSVSPIVRAIPATAPCDWLAALRSDVSRFHPSVVVLEAAGNSATPCMQDPTTGKHYLDGSPRFYAKYRSDLDAFFATVSATGATTVFVAPPPAGARLERHNRAEVGLVTIARSEAHKYPKVVISDVASFAVSSANGSFTPTKRCLAGETSADGCDHGVIRVRGPDGLHFCPVGYASLAAMMRGCPVYSSGAVRFGRAVVAAALHSNTTV
jgi:hypothetical protein